MNNADNVLPSLNHAIRGFDAVCILGEIFNLQPVDRSSGDKSYAGYLQNYERPKFSKESMLEIPRSVQAKDYINSLIVMYNHFRTIVYTLYSSTVSIFQTMLIVAPPELMDTTSREIQKTAEKLPPMFHTSFIIKLTDFATKILDNVPVNHFEINLQNNDFSEATSKKKMKNSSETSKKKMKDNSGAKRIVEKQESIKENSISKSERIKSDATQSGTKSGETTVTRKKK